ncbi:MAG: hypothetical protein FRX49_09685, partial [Trebouxia sp. A1-2]
METESRRAELDKSAALQRYARPDLTLQRLSRKHRDDHCVKCQGSPLLVAKVAVVVGPAAAEQKGNAVLHSCKPHLQARLAVGGQQAWPSMVGASKMHVVAYK